MYHSSKKKLLNSFFKGCDNGSYGVDCKENCGHCRNVSQCFHVNRTCLTGCDEGYQGTVCNIREYTKSYKNCFVIIRKLKR